LDIVAKKKAKNKEAKSRRRLFGNLKFEVVTENVILEKDWKRYEIDLSEPRDLEDITHPFGFEISKGKGTEKSIFYIKGVTFDEEPVDQTFEVLENVVTTTEPLSLQLTANSTEGGDIVAPATVEFGVNVSNGEGPYSFDWNFDDGTTEEDNTDNRVLHTFSSAGTYNVTVVATDSLNNAGSASIVIDVVAAAEPDAAIEQELAAEPFAANIVSNGTEGVAPATFELSANVTGDSEEPYSYVWNFDDGEEVEEEGEDGQDVVHTFSEPGTYVVTLTVTSDDDQTSSDSIEIQVREPEDGGEGEDGSEVPPTELSDEEQAADGDGAEDEELDQTNGEINDATDNDDGNDGDDANNDSDAEAAE